ncbi:DUF4157 domain-containing protein [Bradyrhizobium sp. Arg816]|uniref:eCIS core domain-containing protein n=1 Tax=Bradyrhizobium sp. Arg816 TaxID=2998491 RepID=UPI00249F0897|nr:DUF4157 domain-containing protein [Bradyrhizobium sp. Arg816]MDI3560160.1 DUF4157 domain-containing protein [Bradyrhizobium sp. Arg816]
MSRRALARTAEPPVRPRDTALPGAHDLRSVRPRGLLAPAVTPANDIAPPPPDSGTGRDFAALPALGVAGRIDDADAARTLVTRLLIDELAPLLGLDPTRIRIRVDEPARATLEARGATGLQSGDEILLHPHRYRPETPAGRYLLAHEATHVAQRWEGTAARLAVVEDEADTVALAFARRRPTRRPRFSPTTTEPAAFEGPDPERAFANLVRENYAEELALIRDVLSYGVFDWRITDGDVSDVLRILEPLPYATQVALVGSLEDPFPARLADNISSGHFTRYRTPILAAYDAVTQKYPSKLQDDPFDGMDFSGLSLEEHYALQRIIPAFQRTAKGRAWFSNLKPGIAAHVQDILSNTPTFDPNEARKTAMKAEEERAKQLAEGAELQKSEDVAGFLEEARKKLTYHALDWAITDSEVLSLLDKAAKYVNEPPKLRAIVDTLEGEGLMERWVDNIPADALYTDVSKTVDGAMINRRSVFLQVLSFRPAWKNAKAAEELLSGLLDWAITDDDAFIAFQLIKALPENVRAGLLREGKNASRLEDNLSLSIKRGRASNYYTGGKGGEDLQSIKAQLLDDAVWTPAQISKLRQLIQMARAADEGLWVFEQSKTRVEGGGLKEAYADPDFFDRVVQAFELYVPPGFVRPNGTVDAKGRIEYVPEKLEGTAFGTNNFVYQKIIRGLGFLFSHTGRLQIWKESIGGEGLDLREIEPILGGSFIGVEFAKASEVKNADTSEMTDNSVRLDLDHGILEMRAALLAIRAVNYPLPNRKIQTGPINIHGLDLHMEYPQNGVRNATSMRLRIDRIDISDFMMISPSSMVGVEQLAVGEVHVDLMPDSAQTTTAAPDESYAVGAILLSPLYNVLKISDSVDALTKGLFEPESTMEVTLTVGSVSLKGLTTSGGQYVDRIAVADIALRSRNRHGQRRYRERLAAERDRVNDRIVALREAPKPEGPRPRHYVEFDTVPSLLRELRSVEQEIKALDDAQAEVAALEAQVAGGQLSRADQQRLDRDRAFLDGAERGGFALDVGHAEARGIAGRVTMGDASLDDLHAYGNAPGPLLGVLGGPTVARMLRGPDYRGTLAGKELEGGDPNALLKLGDVELSAFSVQSAIPTAEQTEKDFKDAEAKRKAKPYDPWLADEAERLHTRWRNADTYWTLLRAPKLGTDERDAFNAARNALLQDKAFSFENFSATGASLGGGLDRNGATLGLDARTLGVHGVTAGGFTVKDVIGADVRIGAGINLLDLVNGNRPLASASVGAGSLRFSGVENKSSGLAVDQLNFTKLGAHAAFATSGTSAELAAGAIELVGLNYAVSARVLAYRRDKLLTKPEKDRTGAEKAQLKDIDVLLESLKEAQDQLDEANAHLADPKVSDADKAHYTAQKADAEQMLNYWQKSVELKKLTVRDLNIDVTGLGDVLGEGDSLGQALKGGITVTGRGPNRQIVSGITIEGAGARLSAGHVKDTDAGSIVTAGSRASVEKLETGPILGKISFAEDHISLELGIASVETQGLFYAGGDTIISGKGGTKIDTVTIDAEADFDLIDKKDPDGDRRLSKLHLNSIFIGSIAGHDMEYRNAGSGLRLVIDDGSILGVHAEKALVDFAAEAGDALLVRGGTAGFAAIDNLRTVTTTAGGLAVASTLNTASLDASFAEDGHVTADLHAIIANAHVTQKDLDATINAKARSLHLELLPGAKSYKDSTQRFRLGGLDAEVTGSKGIDNPRTGASATKFGGKVTNFDSLQVTRKPDGSVEAPEIYVQEMSLTRLHYDDGKMLIDVPVGQPVTMGPVFLDVTAEANPTPPEKRGKDESAFSRIVVHSLYVPFISAQALTFVLRDAQKGDLAVTLPRGHKAVLRELMVGPRGEEDGFIIKPNDNWNLFGEVALDEANIEGLRADLRSAVISSMDAKGSKLSLEFIGTEDTIFAIEDLEVSQLNGGIKSGGGDTYADKDDPNPDHVSDNIFARLTRAGFHVDTSRWTYAPSIHAHKLQYSKKNGMTLDELDISGLVYEDPDRTLKIDVSKATLPAGKDGVPALKYTPENKLIVPLAEVEDAYIDVYDVMKLGGSRAAVAAGTGAPSKLTYAPRLDTVDLLSGHVNFTVDPKLRRGVNWKQSLGGWLSDRAGPYAIHVDINDGQINFEEVEDKSTGLLADAALGIDYKPGYLDLDSNPPGFKPASLRISILGKGDVVWWNLDDAEATLAATDIVKISTFIKHSPQAPTGNPSEQKASGSLLAGLDFGDVDIHLALPDSGEIKLGNAGSLTLGGEGPGFVIDVTSGKLPTLTTQITKLIANVSNLDLKLDTAGTVLKVGGISINGGRDLELSFDDKGVGDTYTDEDGHVTQNMLPLPKHLRGTLSKATLHNVELQLPPDKEKGP